MKIKLTAEQLKEVKKERLKEKCRLDTIPKSGHGWDIIDCEGHIGVLTELLKNKEVDVYGN